MPNGHDINKKYGPHSYAIEGTSDCKFGCGCWMGPSRSGGPTGLDPFGFCPKNPEDGKFLGGNKDYDLVVTQRIINLEKRVYEAENKLEKVSPTKKKLAERIEQLEYELRQNEIFLKDLRGVLVSKFDIELRMHS